MRISLVTIVLALAFASIALVSFGDGSNGPARVAAAEDKPDAEKAASGYKLVAPLEDLMEVGDDLFYGMEKEIEAKKFKMVKRHALFLAEVSNVVTFAQHESAKTDVVKKQWVAYSASVRDELLKIAQAAALKEPSVADLKAGFKKAEAGCEGCHDGIRDKEEN